MCQAKCQAGGSKCFFKGTCPKTQWVKQNHTIQCLVTGGLRETKGWALNSAWSPESCLVHQEVVARRKQERRAGHRAQLMLRHVVLRGRHILTLQVREWRGWVFRCANGEGFAGPTSGMCLKQRAWFFFFSMIYGLVINVRVCQIDMLPGLKCTLN